MKSIKEPSPPDFEIVDFGGPSGPSPPKNPPEKEGGVASIFSGGFWGRGGAVWIPNIDGRIWGEVFDILGP